MPRDIVLLQIFTSGLFDKIAIESRYFDSLVHIFGDQADQDIMSFLQVQKLLELLMVLGYPGKVSLESFCFPNFQVVADCLHWLVHRYDSSVDLDMDISSEEGRVKFLKSAAQVMLSKAQIKLHLRNLYLGESEAVEELLKVASLLQQANNMLNKVKIEDSKTLPSTKAFELKTIRSLVVDIVNCGAELYDELETEAKLQNLAVFQGGEFLDDTIKDDGGAYVKESIEDNSSEGDSGGNEIIDNTSSDDAF